MKKVLLYFLIMIIIQAVCGFAVSMIWNIVNGSAEMTAMQLIVTSSTASIITIALFMLTKWAPAVKLCLPKDILLWSAVIGFGMLVPSILFEELLPEQLTKDLLADQFKMIMSNSWGYLAVGLLAPIAEELVFRGAIQKAAVEYFNKKFAARQHPTANIHWVGITLTALLFAAIHGNPAQMPHAMLVGMLLGWLCYRSGSIVPGIIVHWINNSIAYAMCYLYPESYDMKMYDLLGQSSLYAILATLLSLVVMATGIYQLHVRTKKQKCYTSTI